MWDCTGNCGIVYKDKTACSRKKRGNRIRDSDCLSIGGKVVGTAVGLS